MAWRVRLLCSAALFHSVNAVFLPVLCQNSLVGINSIGCLTASPRGMCGTAFAYFLPFWKRKMLFSSLQEGLLLMKCCKVQYDSCEGSVNTPGLVSLSVFLSCPLRFSPGKAVSKRGQQSQKPSQGIVSCLEVSSFLLRHHCAAQGSGEIGWDSSIPAGCSALNSSSSAFLSDPQVHALFRRWEFSGSCICQ